MVNNSHVDRLKIILDLQTAIPCWQAVELSEIQGK